MSAPSVTTRRLSADSAPAERTDGGKLGGPLADVQEDHVGDGQYAERDGGDDVAM